MSSLSFVSMSLAAVTAASLIGCTDATTEPTDADYDQVAQSLGAASPSENNAVVVTTQLAAGTVPIGLSLVTLGQFQGILFGVDFHLTVECRDAAGAAMACGDNTASASIDTAWSGELTLPNLHVAAMRSGTWTLSGLTTDRTTIDGGAQFTLESDFTSVTQEVQRSLDVSADVDSDAVVVDDGSHRFVGGEIRYDVSATRTRTTPEGEDSAALSIDAVVTFAADGSATLVLDGDHTYRLDAATGAVIRVGS